MIENLASKLEVLGYILATTLYQNVIATGKAMKIYGDQPGVFCLITLQ